MTIMSKQEIDTNEIAGKKKPTLNLGEINFYGLWHTVKTFCTFFAFVSAFIWFFPQTLPIDEIFMLILLGLGAVCALVSCIVDVFKITHFVAATITKVLTAISVFTLIPFLPIFVAIITYTGTFAFAFVFCIMFPYVITVITYIVRLIIAKNEGIFIENKKKEIITAVAGFLTAVSVLVLCLIIRSTTVTVTNLTMDDLNQQQVYSEYIADFPERTVDGIDITNPTSSKYNADTLSHDDVYDFETTVGGVTYKNKVTIHYEYRDGKWKLDEINEQRDLDNATIDISGTFEGVGKFEGALAMRDFQYTFKIEKLTKDGGTASLVIYDDRTNENLVDTKSNITVVETITENNDIVLNLNIEFNPALEGGIDNVEGKYSVATGTLTVHGFSFNDDIILSIK